MRNCRLSKLLLVIDGSTLPRRRRQPCIGSNLRRLSKCRNSPSDQRTAVNSGPMPLNPVTWPAGPAARLFARQARVPLSLHPFDLLEQQFERSSSRLIWVLRCLWQGRPSPVLNSLSCLPSIAGAAARSRIRLARKQPLIRLTCWTRSLVNTCARAETRRSSLRGSRFDHAHTRGSPRLSPVMSNSASPRSLSSRGRRRRDVATRLDRPRGSRSFIRSTPMNPKVQPAS